MRAWNYRYENHGGRGAHTQEIPPGTVYKIHGNLNKQLEIAPWNYRYEKLGGGAHTQEIPTGTVYKIHGNANKRKEIAPMESPVRKSQGGHTHRIHPLIQLRGHKHGNVNKKFEIAEQKPLP